MRSAKLARKTSETDCQIELNLDGSGNSSVNTQIPFLDHMLDQLAFHGRFDLHLTANGDLQVDEHHTVEDIGILLGQAFDQALGDWKGIARFGSAYQPMDESLARVVVDLSGRPYSKFKADWFADQTGGIVNSLWKHFFQSLATHMKATIHAEVLYGEDDHHKVEALFKALGRSLQEATRVISEKSGQIPSTKGQL